MQALTWQIGIVHLSHWGENNIITVKLLTAQCLVKLSKFAVS